MSTIDQPLFNKIKKYCEKDYSYEAILRLLKEKYNVKMSIRSLYRFLKKHCLKRRNIQESPKEEIIVGILLELEGSGYNLGYRAMWKRLRKVYKLTVKQKTVMKILKEVDPDGVEARSRYRLKRRQYTVPGPNYLWHADGHDKLKRFGFAIHGCIDGYSKKVLWLHVSSSNNDPEVIAYYYMKTIQKLEFLPTLLRTDHGTENVIMQDLHMALRFKHTDEHAGVKSYLKGKSTHNQRIESYWRQFRQHMADFYMSFFKQMESENVLNISNIIHIECLRYCFGPLITEEIEITRKEWNEHRVRKQNGRNVLGGIPNELYHWPERFEATDCKKTLNKEHAQLLLEDYAKNPRLCWPNFEELVNLVLPNHKTPSFVEDAFNLYLEILNVIEKQII